MHPMTAEGLFNQSADNSMLIIAEVESALMNLGYKEKEAQVAIKNAQSDAKNNTSDLLKAALRQLSGF